MLTNYITIPSNLWSNIYTTGSNYICDPPVTDTDIDYIVYSANPKLLVWLEEEGFESCNNDYPITITGLFISLRRGKLNLIITDSYTFYHKWVEATKLAKKLNLKEKEQRITLFKYFLYDTE